MADTTEDLLVLCLAVGASLSGIETAERNLDDITDRALPGFVLIDGDEEAFDNPRARGMAVNTVEMFPQFDVYVADVPENVGTVANEWRAKFQRALLSNAAIATKCTGIPNGGVRYLACNRMLLAGRTSIIKVSLRFGIKYLFNPSAL